MKKAWANGLLRKGAGRTVEDEKEAIGNGLHSEGVGKRVQEKEPVVGEEATGTRLIRGLCR